MQTKTWEIFVNDIHVLIQNMGNYRPNIIVPFMAGGMIPASIIAETLKIRDIRPISVERCGNERAIAYDITGNLNGLKILLVEDALPTGRGSVVVKDIFMKRASCNVKISAVYVTPQSAKVTDFFAKQIDPLPNLPWKPSRTGNRIIRS